MPRPTGTPLKRSHPALRAPLSRGDGWRGDCFFVREDFRVGSIVILLRPTIRPKNIPSWEGQGWGKYRTTNLHDRRTVETHHSKGDFMQQGGYFERETLDK